MKLKAVSGIMLTLLLMGILALAFNIQSAKADPTATTTTKMWVNPPSIDGTGRVGETIIVNVWVDSPDVGIYSWQAGIRFNNTVLNCTAIPPSTYVCPFFAGKPTGTFYRGGILNDQGLVRYSGQSVQWPEKTGVTGTGVLMWFEFKVLASGISDLHLADVKVNKAVPPIVEPFDCLVIDTYTVIADGYGAYLVEIVHNITGTGWPPSGLYSYAFNLTAKEISFKATGPIVSQLSFCNVTIPKGLLRTEILSDWIVLVDDVSAIFLSTENATHTSLYFTFTTSTRNIRIRGTIVLSPEYTLAIYSSPTGVTFTVDGVSRTAPWSLTYIEGTSVSLVMLETHDGYVWSYWLEDGDPNRIKTVTMDTNITLTGIYAGPVGGKATPISMPMTELQIPWIWLSTTLLAIAVMTVVYFKKRKRNTETNS